MFWEAVVLLKWCQILCRILTFQNRTHLAEVQKFWVQEMAQPVALYMSVNIATFISNLFPGYIVLPLISFVAFKDKSHFGHFQVEF